ncbi:unnamed protein product, partial [Didymodactylos carnosus]
DKQEHIEKEKSIIIPTIQTKTGLRLNQCDYNSFTTGGTSTTGEEGQKFFSYEARDVSRGNPTK